MPMTGYTKLAMGAAAVVGTGAMIGGVGGAVWDDENRSGAGAAFAGKAGAAAYLAYKSFKVGPAGFKKMGMAAGLPSMVIGGVVGAMTGPTDSLVANTALGAIGGVGGAMIGRNLGKHGVGKMSMNKQTGLYSGITALKSGPAFMVGKHAGTGKGRWDKFAFKGRAVSTAHVGATAGALFTPHIAHGLIGRSREDKGQNSFNKY